jgi:chitinase
MTIPGNIKFRILFVSLVVSLLCGSKSTFSQETRKPMVVIAYYMGDGSNITNYKTEQLTHIIYSFLHLKGNKLAVDNVNDSLAITRLVALKKTNPKQKIILSLGGWGGCKTCSEVFNTETGRQEFALSVLQLFKDYNADGLDLDWEYPAIESVPGHQYIPEDRQNFTYLIRTLRETIGQDYELSFAAGGFRDFLTNSVEWNKVMPLVNYVNMMTYDLVNGNSKHTGHLTSLYSTPEQNESTDHAIMFLDSIGVPMQKVVIGTAFYARLFSGVEPVNNGLYQKGKFSGYVIYKDIDEKLGAGAGYQQYWDSKAKAPYAYNANTKTFATFDNLRSVYEKTKYAKARNLAGVMFWELSGDKESGGLLDMIYEGSIK